MSVRPPVGLSIRLCLLRFIFQRLDFSHFCLPSVYPFRSVTYMLKHFSQCPSIYFFWPDPLFFFASYHEPPICLTCFQPFVVHQSSQVRSFLVSWSLKKLGTHKENITFISLELLYFCKWKFMCWFPQYQNYGKIIWLSLQDPETRISIPDLLQPATSLIAFSQQKTKVQFTATWPEALKIGKVWICLI